MSLFPKFDPRTVVDEVHERTAKVTKADNIRHPDTHSLAGLATLADSPEEFCERAAITEFDGEIPREWAEGLARLITMSRPAHTTERRWERTVAAACDFADRWAAKASALGWSTLDIFGVDQHKPDEALHTAGLIWLLGDASIVAISKDTIVVQTTSGTRQSIRPRLDTSDRARRITLWELDL